MVKVSVSTLVKAATDESLVTVDWLRTMQVCEHVKAREDGPKEACKAIKNRMFHRNPKVIILSMKVLESCVIHCGKRFHLKLVSKDFLTDYCKLIVLKNLAAPVKKKGLSLLQVWSHAFGHVEGLGAVTVAYDDLKAKGVQFPPLEQDLVAQIAVEEGSAASQNSAKLFADLAAKEQSSNIAVDDDEEEEEEEEEEEVPENPEAMSAMDEEALKMMQEILGAEGGEAPDDMMMMAEMLMDLKEVPPPPSSKRRERNQRSKKQAAQSGSTGAVFASDADFDKAFK
eukprot:Lithocolla_globosa_v1_NODE_6790_length_1034_cov_71.206333.p1 type:complete len:284 gc:universal NODE_6790_length_1034_cov_71.206333:48-899(+)